jgi:hypothetical protein
MAHFNEVMFTWKIKVGMYGRKPYRNTPRSTNIRWKLARYLINFDDNCNLVLVQWFGIGLIECFSKWEEDGGRCKFYLGCAWYLWFFELFVLATKSLISPAIYKDQPKLNILPITSVWYLSSAPIANFSQVRFEYKLDASNFLVDGTLSILFQITVNI